MREFPSYKHSFIRLYANPFFCLDSVDKGLIKSIGVSNFDVEELDHLLANCRIKPAVNQIESHPFFQHEDLREATIARGILVQAYSPMAQGAALERPEILAIAKKHDKSAAQILLRWGMQVGNIILPKSLTKSRIEANADLFDFELDSDDMDLLNSCVMLPFPSSFFHTQTDTSPSLS